VSAADLFGLENNMNKPIDASIQEADAMMQKEVGTTDFELTIYEPGDPSEERERVIRTAETNLGDLLCDALRDKYDTDAAVIGGGGIRSSIPAGPITYDSIFTVEPFGHEAIVCEISGQQLLDMLEWGSRGYPEEFGGFLQVSGITYEIHKSVPSSCSVTADGFFASVDGEYRVKNVKVNGEDLNLNRKYTLAGPDYTLVQHGNGYNMISEEEVTKATGELFTDIFIGYIRDTMKGKVSDDYSDPAGQGRIVIVD
jgi:2',3'-cyclic-nucleotide 2'-phosphodiesterase (5'-nucleotidase family)